METNRKSRIASVFFFLISLPSVSFAYRPGDIVPMSKMGQYHSSRTVWHDMIGKHCPIFAVNREVLIPIAMPTGYTGSDPYKLSFQVGKEKFLIPWLFVIHRKSSEVPMIDVHLVKIAFRYFILFFMVTGFYCALQPRRMVCFMKSIY
uniref:Uncharacterized protein n=1 Tax=Populus davidiana TaxID=266767 RepID=A0A6M2E6M4_9ROSI